LSAKDYLFIHENAKINIFKIMERKVLNGSEKEVRG